MSNFIDYKEIMAFHPGYYVAEIIEDMGISQAEFALRMGTTAKTLSKLVNGRISISDDLAKPPFFVYPLSNYAYSDLPSRMVLESRLYYWCMEFSKLYPGELHTYYEDEDFVCYYFKQNQACLYQLGFQSGEEFEKQGNTLNDKKNN